MFGIFKKKSLHDKLSKQYQKLMKEAYELSTVNRKASDEKYAEADRLILQIERIKN